VTSLTIGSIADLDRVVDRGVNITIVEHIVENVYASSASLSWLEAKLYVLHRAVMYILVT